MPWRSCLQNILTSTADSIDACVFTAHLDMFQHIGGFDVNSLYPSTWQLKKPVAQLKTKNSLQKNTSLSPQSTYPDEKIRHCR